MMNSIARRNSQGSFTVSEHDRATDNESSVSSVETTRSIPQVEAQDNTRTALDEYKLTKRQKVCRILGGMAVGTAVGAGAGAGVGALVGLFAGPVGSAVGAAVGGLVGGLAGGITGTVAGVKKARKTPEQVLVSELRSTNGKIYKNWEKTFKTREAWFKAWRKLPKHFEVNSSAEFEIKMRAENGKACELDRELTKIKNDLSDTGAKIDRKMEPIRKLEKDIEYLNNSDRHRYQYDGFGRRYRDDGGFMQLGVDFVRIQKLRRELSREWDNLRADSEYQDLVRSYNDLRTKEENKKKEINTHEKEIAPLRKIEKQVLKARQLEAARKDLENKKAHHEEMMRVAGFKETDPEYQQYVGKLKS